MAVLRTALGGLAAVPLLLALRLPLPNDGGRWRLLAVSSSCGFLAFPALFSAGMQSTSAVHGAMLLALLPRLLSGSGVVIQVVLLARIWCDGWSASGQPARARRLRHHGCI